MHSTSRFKGMTFALLFTAMMSAHGDDIRIEIDSEGWALIGDLTTPEAEPAIRQGSNSAEIWLLPGEGHCGSQYPGALNAVMDWAEQGITPVSLERSPGVGVPKGCPFPQTAIYDGVGDTADPDSYSCGGNLQTKEMICDSLRTP